MASPGKRRRMRGVGKPAPEVQEEVKEVKKSPLKKAPAPKKKKKSFFNRD